MRGARFTSALAATSLFTMAASQSIFQVADIPFYSSLAPCAMSAVSYAVNYLTNSKCPEGTAFQSCACTKQGNSAGVQATITSSVKYSCGATATEDFSSASLVFHQYCNQASGLSSPGAGNTQVSHAITDVPYFADLAPCAASAVRYAVEEMTDYLCQPGIPQLNSCACTKNQNSFAVSSMIQSNVQYSCGATHSADITSALALFAGWCKMADGTTDFPTASNLGGALSYYITDLPDFSSMAKCAQSAVFYGVFTMTNYLCPEYPAALASCVCAKDGNVAEVSKYITINVKYSCDITATEDVTSAMAVFDQYCAAAKGEVTPAGITASIPERTSTAIPAGSTAPPAFPSPTAPPNNGLPPRTTSPPSTSTAADGSLVILPGTTSPATSGSSTSKGPIIGGAVGGVAILAIAGFAIWFLVRRHKRNKAAVAGAPLGSAGAEEEKATGTNTGEGGLYKGPNANTSELHNDELAAAAAAGTIASPVSAASTPRPTGSELAGSPKPLVARKPLSASPPPYGSELGGSPRPPGNELYAGHQGHVHDARVQGSELQGSGYAGQSPGVYEAPPGQGGGGGYNGYNGYEGQQMYGNNAGPVYEMPGQGWGHGPHR